MFPASSSMWQYSSSCELIVSDRTKKVVGKSSIVDSFFADVGKTPKTNKLRNIDATTWNRPILLSAVEIACLAFENMKPPLTSVDCALRCSKFGRWNGIY